MSLFFNYEAFGMLPGINAIAENVVNAITWGPWEHNRAFIVPTLLDSAGRDLGSDPTDLLRPGLLMGCVTGTKKAKPYDHTGGDGTQNLMGVLLYDVKLQAGGTNKDRWFGFILVSGNVKSTSLIYGVAASTPGSWIGGAQDATIRTQLSNNFFITDDGWYV
jgi:hypothetical protein